MYETSRQSRFDAWYWMLGPGALGRPRGMVWGRRREEGSGWGTHVYLLRIHFDIWQNQYNIVKLSKIKLINKILRDDAVKTLHSICQQIWKTQQWPQDWKRSVFTPVLKKGSAKECSSYHTLVLISHASKVMLKSLQAETIYLRLEHEPTWPGLKYSQNLPYLVSGANEAQIDASCQKEFSERQSDW